MTDPPAVDPEAVKPTSDEVAILLKTRTRSDDGTEFGTFTDQTSPTYDEVSDLIDLAATEVLAQLPDEIDPTFYRAITRLISLRAAALVELSFFRNQNAGSNAPGAGGTLTAMFLSDLAALQDFLRGLPLRLV